MSPKQESYYWREWAAVCRVLGWKNSDTKRRHALAAFACASAQRMAALDPLAVREQIIRDGTVALPVGRSHTVWSNDEFDQWIKVCRLMIEGTDIKAVKAILNPEGERTRLMTSIYRLIQEYGEEDALALMLGRFRGLDWISLPMEQMQHLRFTLTARVHARKQKAENGQVGECESEQEPISAHAS